MERPSTILCIDDEPETLRLRRQLLEAHGFRVITATSGADGLRLLTEGHAVQLVLLDYVMPGMGGDWVAKELKRLYPQMPIILVSGYPELPKPLLQMVDGYVRKGQEPEVAIGLITETLSAKR
jgi:CheY-like chemotaxis protein